MMAVLLKIIVHAPIGVIANTPFIVTGILSGYATPPTLQYQDNYPTGKWTSAPFTVTNTTFSFIHPGVPVIGAMKVAVFDANNHPISASSPSFSVSPKPLPLKIIVNAPNGVIANTPFMVTGSLSGYVAPPTLQYQDNYPTGKWTSTVFTVTATNFSFIHPGVDTTSSMKVAVFDANNHPISASSPSFSVSIPDWSPGPFDLIIGGPSIDISATLPTGIIPGGIFGVSTTGASLAAGITLSPNGMLSATNDTIPLSESGVIFSYIPPTN